MKITVEIDKNYIEDEIVIKCKNFNDDLIKIQNVIRDITNNEFKLELYKEAGQYYISPGEIIYIESAGKEIFAHTVEDKFTVKHKLYELEQILPKYFVRISKSTILNAKEVYSITRNLSSVGIVEFKNSAKKVFVSRGYYKLLKDKMREVR